MKEHLYELRVIDQKALDDLNESPKFRRLENRLRVHACSEIEARQEAYRIFPMCDAHDATPEREAPSCPDILRKYPNLWENEKLTSCIPIIS